jgi:hypothetical protein
MPAGASAAGDDIAEHQGRGGKAAFRVDGYWHIFHAAACRLEAVPRKGRDTGLFVIAVMSFID